MQDRLRLLEKRDIDEIIILDVSATPNRRSPRFAEIAELSSNLFCPVTFGGGIRTLADCQSILRSGADKIAIGTAAIERPAFIREVSEKCGAQAITVAVDVKQGTVWSRCGTLDTGKAPVEWAADLESLGAGEILLTSIERDGSMTGYDLDLIEKVSNAVGIPVIAAGGCGSYDHMVQAMNAGAHAVASGAMFQFCDTTPKDAARHLHEAGIPTRL